MIIIHESSNDNIKVVIAYALNCKKRFNVFWMDKNTNESYIYINNPSSQKRYSLNGAYKRVSKLLTTKMNFS